MNDDSDANLIARFRSGDDIALNIISARYEVPLFQFLYGILRNHHDAQDSLQKTLTRMLGYLEEGDENNLRGWLFAVAYHQAILVKHQ